VAILATAIAGCTGIAAQNLTSIERSDALRGDVTRGREVIVGRDGNCLLCHAVAATGAQFMGNPGPPLDGIGARMNEAELRVRIEDPRRFNPDSIMPSYARTEGLVQVGKAWRGKPILNAQQIEDSVAFLATLR
jgi:L-cysteine S-thiosulfotransferase